MEEDRVAEAGQVQERLQQDADRISATLRGNLAETGEQLSLWLLAAPSKDWGPDEGLLLILTDGALSAFPPGKLIYSPAPSPEPEAPASAFVEGEGLEFSQRQPEKAAEWYARLAESKDAAIRAGALMRLGRVTRSVGRLDASRAAYERLRAISGARVAGAPAELVARHALCELFPNSAQASSLKQDLLNARWSLSRSQFEFFLEEAGRLTGRQEPAPAEAAALSDAAAQVWSDWKREPTAKGQRLVWTEGRPWLVVWRGAPGREAALAIEPESLLKRACANGKVLCAAVDSDGRLIAGRKEGTGRAAVRTAAESQLPWTLYVTDPRRAPAAGALARQRDVLLGLAVMVLFLIAGTYFIARAIRRETEVSRQQSHFVSAVSHEFRSPLTSMRQLSEMLALGRVPGEDRREKYYETLVSETRRLQRLVETVLNFGKMEAGAKQYRFEEVDAGDLVARAAAEFEPQIVASGRRIELNGAPNGCRIKADPEALVVALRNLLDNALKYSPGQPAVWVEWGPVNGRVAIRVRDKGIGIAASERKAIFRKFVRGSGATVCDVKGTGVGLAMVKHIVAAHGGGIQVESEPGQGSAFTILLPAVERV